MVVAVRKNHRIMLSFQYKADESLQIPMKNFVVPENCLSHENTRRTRGYALGWKAEPRMTRIPVKPRRSKNVAVEFAKISPKLAGIHHLTLEKAAGLPNRSLTVGNEAGCSQYATGHYRG